MLSRIWSAVLVQTKGLGSSLCTSMYSRMAASSSLTLRNTPRRIRLLVMLGKPAFHQVDPRAVGGREVDVETGTLGEPVPDDRRLVGAVVIHDDMRLQIGGHVGLDHIQELAEFQERWRRCNWPMTRLVFSSSAANSDVVPWRL